MSYSLQANMHAGHADPCCMNSPPLNMMAPITTGPQQVHLPSTQWLASEQLQTWQAITCTAMVTQA